MARASINISLGGNLGEGQYAATYAPTKDAATQVTLASTGADGTTLTAAVAAAQAKGAGDASAEVDAVDAAWVVVLADLATVASGNVNISFDTTAVTKKNQLKRALEAALRAVESGIGGLT